MPSLLIGARLMVKKKGSPPAASTHFPQPNATALPCWLWLPFIRKQNFLWGERRIQVLFQALFGAVASVAAGCSERQPPKRQPSRGHRFPRSHLALAPSSWFLALAPSSWFDGEGEKGTSFPWSLARLHTSLSSERFRSKYSDPRRRLASNNRCSFFSSSLSLGSSTTVVDLIGFELVHAPLGYRQ